MVRLGENGEMKGMVNVARSCVKSFQLARPSMDGHSV